METKMARAYTLFSKFDLKEGPVTDKELLDSLENEEGCASFGHPRGGWLNVTISRMERTHLKGRWKLAGKVVAGSMQGMRFRALWDTHNRKGWFALYKKKEQ